MNDRRDAQERLPYQDSDGRKRIPFVPISGLAIPKLGRDEPLAQVEPCEQTSRPEFIFPIEMHEYRHPRRGLASRLLNRFPTTN
jgi:hypothetical protein